jgi:hypothetical protein
MRHLDGALARPQQNGRSGKGAGQLRQGSERKAAVGINKEYVRPDRRNRRGRVLSRRDRNHVELLLREQRAQALHRYRLVAQYRDPNSQPCSFSVDDSRSL